MAEKVIIQLTDDLDGTDASETIHFAVNGSAYRIDLSEKNSARFWEAIKPFVEAAQPAGSAARRPRPGPSSSSSPSDAAPAPRKRRSSGAAAAGVSPAAVRVWASENNVEVPARGRIPATVISQYKAATGG